MTRLDPGDALLLSSDGLHGLVHPSAIAAILSDGLPHLKPTVKRLIHQANQEGGEDNITALLVQLKA